MSDISVSMIQIKSQKDLNRLRRLALTSQGLLQSQPYGKGIAGAREAIKHIGYVQIDTISVVGANFRDTHKTNKN